MSGTHEKLVTGLPYILASEVRQNRVG